MKTTISFLIFISSLLLSNIVNAQNSLNYNNLFYEKYNAISNQNLKDSVKSVHLKISKPKEDIPEYKKTDAIFNNGIRGPVYFYFDKFQRLQKRSGIVFPRLNYLEDDSKTENEYEYNEADWVEKKELRSTLKKYYPVMDYNLLIKLNQISIPKADEISEEDGKIWPHYREDKFEYEIDDAGRIINAKEYFVYRTGKETMNKKVNDNDLVNQTTFIYNEKGQVTNQKITVGLYAQNKIAYHFLGTECSYCKDLQLQYEYDSKSRIIKIIMFGCGKVVAQQDYSYNSIKDYVETVKYYVTGNGGIANPTRNFVKTFNEQGDIIKREYIPDYPDQDIIQKISYYTYQYDSHNNWIKCNIFLEGTPDREPTLVAERKIEYYN
ncbi:hypothetical protein [Flavobacterium chilense]|uniref:YD repeat-containing protein n=1 Tax=Flavobacterium chilense TaxID=946677 RepID=A0A1M7ERX3_9FLAO|nr:hypothetical protein [Flavobacterium chilense]SHL94484.1 hypothetical protein SAMN05444484_10349 [Flavobacterium chilense]